MHFFSVKDRECPCGSTLLKLRDVSVSLEIKLPLRVQFAEHLADAARRSPPHNAITQHSPKWLICELVLTLHSLQFLSYSLLLVAHVF
jgi:hypothetical protein